MNIIVNGGSRGIGRELAVHFADDPDNQLLVTGRGEKALKELAGGWLHENVSYLTFDLSLLDFQIVSFKDQIYSRFSKVDILINNAGSLTVKEFMKMSN